MFMETSRRRSLDRELRDLRADGIHLRLGQVLHLGVGVDPRALTSSPRTSHAHAKYVRKPDPDVLVHRYVDASYTCHISLPPTMTRKKRSIVRV